MKRYVGCWIVVKQSICGGVDFLFGVLWDWCWYDLQNGGCKVYFKFKKKFEKIGYDVLE